MKSLVIIFFSTLLICSCNRDYETYKLTDFKHNFAVKEERDSLYSKLKNSNIKKSISKPEEVNNLISGITWASVLIQYKEADLLQYYKNCFGYFNKLNISARRSLLEGVFSLFPDNYYTEVTEAIKETRHPKNFAMAVNYLVRADEDSSKYIKLTEQIFPKWKEHPILFMLHNQLSGKLKTNTPPLKDLLKQDSKGYPVIFSFQRSNRDYIGLSIIRDKNGEFLTNSDGSLFSIPQFARAVTNMPSFLTNGNSPQGIYHINGTDVSSNRFIGPVPNIQTRMPFEENVGEFFSVNVKKEWHDSLYSKMLPESWKNYLPIYESYYAGKAGRSEIIMHGTTINPVYYYNEIFYPHTPSLGCITTKETWSPDDGFLTESNQLKLMNKWLSVDSYNGYLVLLNLDNKESDVTVEEIKMILNKITLYK